MATKLDRSGHWEKAGSLVRRPGGRIAPTVHDQHRRLGAVLPFCAHRATRMPTSWDRRQHVCILWLGCWAILVFLLRRYVVLHIGFTGTRLGMTDAQRIAVDVLFAELIGGDLRLQVVAHHGDCIGADAQFHAIARQYGAMLVGHIPLDKTHRAFCSFDSELPPLPHMKRNKAVVDVSGVMIATPFEMIEQPRGGTWATIRMAQKVRKPMAIVLPNGVVLKDGLL